MNAITPAAALTALTPATLSTGGGTAPAAEANAGAEAPASFARLLGQARAEPGAAEARDDAVAERPPRGTRTPRLASATPSGAGRDGAALARGADKLPAPAPDGELDTVAAAGEGEAADPTAPTPTPTPAPTLTPPPTSGDASAATLLASWHGIVRPQPAPSPSSADTPATADEKNPAVLATAVAAPAAALPALPSPATATSTPTAAQAARPSRGGRADPDGASRSAPAAPDAARPAAVDAAAPAAVDALRSSAVDAARSSAADVARPLAADAARPASADTARVAPRAGDAADTPAAAASPAAAPAPPADKAAASARSVAAELPSALAATPLVATPPEQVPTSVPVAAAEGRITPRPGSAEFAPELGARISTFVRDGVQHARLELNPAALGPVSVQIQLDGQAAQVHLAAAQAETRAALEQAMPQLAGSLREAGLTLAGGGVFDQPRQPQAEAGAPQSGRTRREPEGQRDDASAAQAMAAPRRRGVVDLVA